MTLVLGKLAVGYAGTRGLVLSDLSLEASAGAFVCILGRNGAGKSTLMRTIAGLQPPLAGTLELSGQQIGDMHPTARARRIAVVLTERPSSPGLTVEDVVSLGRQPFTDWRGRLTEEDRRLVAAALARAGVSAFAGRFFDDLSDGERQRVMIARAFAQTPQLMVLDEITAFLDLPGRVEVMSLLRRQARDTGVTVLLSSHDLDLSLQLADTLWLLDGSGAVHVGTPEQLATLGHLGRAFDTDEVKFSPGRGRFELMAE